MVTVLQEEQIRQLRSQGIGYRNIANQLNLTRDAVRNYCKAHNLNGYREAVQANMQRMAEDDSVCTYCGAKLIQPHTGRKKRFCNDICRRKWWNQNRDKIRENPDAIYGFKCKCCGKEFTAYGNRNRQYCSHQMEQVSGGWEFWLVRDVKLAWEWVNCDPEAVAIMDTLAAEFLDEYDIKNV